MALCSATTDWTLKTPFAAVNATASYQMTDTKRQLEEQESMYRYCAKTPAECGVLCRAKKACSETKREPGSGPGAAAGARRGKDVATTPLNMENRAVHEVRNETRVS